MVDFPLLVFVVSFAMLVIAAWIGDFARKRFKASEEANRDDSGVVLAGTLTLLGLIIGLQLLDGDQPLRPSEKQRAGRGECHRGRLYAS